MRTVGWGVGLVIASMLGCASAEDGPPAPTSCELEQRQGTYLMRFIEVAGTCGPLVESLVTFGAAPPSDGGAPENGCRALREDRITEGGCKLDRELECVTRIEDASVYGGWYSRTEQIIAVTRQMTADGSRIEGLLTLAASSMKGSCRSTYNVTATRQ